MSALRLFCRHSISRAVLSTVFTRNLRSLVDPKLQKVVQTKFSPTVILESPIVHVPEKKLYHSARNWNRATEGEPRTLISRRMKFSFFFAIFAAWMYFLTKRTQTQKNDTPTKNITSTNKFLDDYESLANHLSKVSSQERVDFKNIILLILDFERTNEERLKSVWQMQEKWNLSDDEMMEWEKEMYKEFLIDNRIRQMAPKSGKIILHFHVDMLINDKFIFGSREDRERIYETEENKLILKLEEDPVLSMEMNKLCRDMEYLRLIK